MTNFHVGQRVVCVDADRHEEWLSNRGANGPMHGLNAGKVYTVARFETCRDGRAGLHLVEINRPCCTPWQAIRFRPVASKPTSMDLIRAIVAGGPITDGMEPKRIPVPEYDAWGLRL